MLDIGWSEMAVIALVALVVIGPKDLPKAMKTAAFWVRKARKLASEFHSGIDQLMREAELEEARDAIRSASQMNVDRALESTIDPTGELNKALQPPSEADLKAPPAPAVSPEGQGVSQAPGEPETGPAAITAPPVSEPKTEPTTTASEPTKSEPAGV
jgi:sec-independent protein translocase protein TatB